MTSNAPASAAAPSKADFDLHVLLIMRKEKVTKSKALFTAWLEGREGLNKRLPS